VTRIAGVEGAGSAPNLQQNAGVTWDMPLAQVSITTAGVMTLTDERQFLQGLGDGGVGTAKLADGAVTTAKIADNAVTTGKIAAGAVGTTDIADDAVTAAKIAAGAVGASEIADGAVGASEIADGAVGTSELADDAVSNAKLANMAVNRVKGRITTGTGDPEDLTATQLVTIIKTADGTGTGLDADLLDGLNADAFAAASHSHGSTDLADGSVTAAKLATGAVTSTKLGTAAVGTAALAAKAVTGAKVDDGTITATQLADGAVTAAKLGTGAVTATKLAAGAVGATALATDAVSAAKIADGAVGTAALANAAVTNAKLADMASGKIKGRFSEGAGDPEDMSATQVLELASTAWTTLSPGAHTVLGGRALQYRKVGDMLQLRGNLDIWVHGLIATLPAGFRPPHTVTVGAVIMAWPSGPQNHAFQKVTIQSDGQILAYTDSGAVGDVSFDGIAVSLTA
jgi:hypothetical protein